MLTVPEPRRGPADPERPEDEGYSRFWLRVTAASDGRRWHPARGRAIVTATGDRTDLAAGDPVEAAGSLARLARPLNPGERDRRDLPRSRGIRLELSVGDRESLSHDPRAAPAWPSAGSTGSARGAIDGLPTASTPGCTAGLGLADRPSGRDRSGCRRRLRRDRHGTPAGDLRAAPRGDGRTALAGLPVAPGAQAASALVLVAVLGYATLVGWTPSVGRAAVMVAVLCAASLVDRGRRPANGLALAALVTLLINPCFLFDVGWQLSFLAVGTLMFAFPPAARWMNRRPTRRPRADVDPLDVLERRLEPPLEAVRRGVPSWYPAMLLASVVVWIVCLPLVVWRFHVVAPIGMLLNVPLIPIVGPP